MKNIGAVVLSFEEAGELAEIIPWKIKDSRWLFDRLKKEGLPITGLLFISTCNRVEIIYSIDNPDFHDQIVSSIFDIMPPLKEDIRPSSYQGYRAVSHLVRLSVGLESMVLGETEIRAQIKDSLLSSRHASMIDQRMDVLFREIFRESREIRSSIPMANLPLSVATLATKHLEEFPGFARKTRENDVKRPGKIAIIGSGPMSRQAAEYLAFADRELLLVNRSLDKVKLLADRLNVKSVSFDDFMNNPTAHGPLSAVITATSREDAFLSVEFASKVKAHHDQTVGQDEASVPLVFIDMALPPDVDVKVETLPGVKLVSMETLRKELETNRKKRAIAAASAEGMIEGALYRIEAQMITALSAPIITKIQKGVREKAERNMDILLNDRLSHLSAKDRRVIHAWMVQSHRDLNRIHRRGLETILKTWFAKSGTESRLHGS